MLFAWSIIVVRVRQGKLRQVMSLRNTQLLGGCHRLEGSRWLDQICFFGVRQIATGKLSNGVLKLGVSAS
jgi:hypothetical protein